MNFTSNLWVIPIFLSAQVLAAENQSPLTPRSEKIVQNFIAEGKITPSQEKSFKVIPTPKSRSVRSLLFLEGSDSSCPLVIKVFRDIDKYYQEKKLLNETGLYIDLVNELQKNHCQDTLPYIMEFKGGTQTDQTGAVLLTKAHGHTIKQILSELGLSSTDEEHLMTIFKEIGQQLGTLDGLFFSKNSQAVLYHPDSHQENFIYNEKTKQLYMIDTAGLFLKKLESARELNPDSYNFVKSIKGDIFGIDQSTRSLLNSPFEPDPLKVNVVVEKLKELKKSNYLEKVRNYRKELTLKIFTLKGFYMGYSESLSKQGISNTVMIDFRSLFEGSGEHPKRFQDINEELAAAGVEEIKVPL